MKKVARIILVVILIAGLVLGTVGLSLGALLSSGDSNKQKSNGISEAQAIQEVIKKHPDFPSSIGTVTKKLPIGGAQSSTADVKFTTKVETASDAYVITLIKDWGISVNGKYVESFWKYKVANDGASLVDSEDNDNLVKQMK